MRKIIIAVALITALLSGCTEREKKDLELEFIEVKIGTYDYPYLVFVSHEEKAYFKMYITSYEYNNLELKKGDKITFSVTDDSFNSKVEYLTEWQGEENTLTEFDYLIK